MYGTVATMRLKPGMESRLNEIMEEWYRDRAPKVKGAVSSTVFKTDRDPNELILVAVFDNKQNYEANAGDPEQDAWYRKMRDCLEADPQWTDGEVVNHKQV
jgi:quinol monooxygenase YgiN